MLTKRLLLLGLAVGLIAAVGVRLASPPAVPIPAIELTTVDPLVAAAVRQAQHAVEDQPSSAAAWGELAMVLIAHDYVDQGKRCFERASELDPHDGRWWYYRGHLAETADLAESVKCFQNAAQAMASSVPVRLRLARGLIKLNRLDDAQSELKIAQKQQPHDPHVQLELGRLAAARGYLLEAKQQFEKAASAPGWYPGEAYAELSRVCQRLQDYECARAAAQQFARLPEASADNSDWLLNELQSRQALFKDDATQADRHAARAQWAQAITIYRRLISNRPNLTRVKLNLAHALGMTGKNDEAIAICQEIVQQEPGNAQAWLSLAYRFEQISDANSAIACYRQCTRLMPDHAQSHFNLGLLLEANGDIDGAQASYKQATIADPGFAPAHLALGVILQNKGQQEAEAAIVYLKNAVHLKPNDPVPKSYLDQALESQSQQNSELEPAP